MTQKAIQFISLDKLLLDIQSPRLPLSFKETGRNQRNTINWLLENSSIIELMLAIGQNGFFVGEALLVVKDTETENHIVVEGIRRLTSLKLLNQPELANVRNTKIKKILVETKERPINIPCIVFNERSEILQYLGYKHITGVKSWSLVVKARYMNSMLQTLNDKSISENAKELAKKFGTRSDYVKKILVSYQIFSVITENDFYKIPNLNETTFHFHYITDSLAKEHICRFIGIDLTSDNPLENFKKNNLAELIDWFYKKNNINKNCVLVDSVGLNDLNDVLSSENSLKYFREYGNLKDSLKYVNFSIDSSHANIYGALQFLKRAQKNFDSVDKHHYNDIEILKEIKNLCSVMDTSPAE